jgi:hypothetical protein
LVSRSEFVASVWAFRASVEEQDALRFERLSHEVSGFDARSPVVEMLHKAAQDEQRHAEHCWRLTAFFGGQGRTEKPMVPKKLSPASLGPRQSTLYEMMATCCVAETESLATLTSLVPTCNADIQAVLRELARDEVRHAQMGWAHVSREISVHQIDARFLGPLVPLMLEGTATPALFAPAESAWADDEAIGAFGVLTHSQKRSIFVSTLREVIIPGLEALGIESGAAQQWLSEKGV